MKTLPNGVKIFNATPHVIRFWREDWDEPVEVEPDEIISAKVVESVEPKPNAIYCDLPAEFVVTKFVGTDEGHRIVRDAYRTGADLVVGSIIAAQAYPGQVFAMTPAPGYERRPPAEKRMNPDKFTVF